MRRVRTHAVVEGVSISRDGESVGSRLLFAVNPYGGKADHKDHLGGRG